MPDEEIELTQKEIDAIQRLADAKNMTFDTVLEFVGINALMSYPRDEEPGK